MSRAPRATVDTPCAAPWSSLHLDPRGVVRVCCENKNYVLGRTPAQSLDEIWRGDRLQQLRRAVQREQLDHGCDGCAEGLVVGPRSRSRASLYDEYRVGSDPTAPRRLELELSNRCNLECVMCNGELSSRIRSRREHLPPLPAVYDDRFYDELARLAPGLEHVSFQGGEPFLARESLRAFDVLIEHGFAGRCHVTTNGTIRSARVERILDRLTVDVSVSVDGWSRATVEAVRVGVDRDALFANMDWFARRCGDRGTAFGLHYCVMPANQHELHDLLRHADRLGARVAVIRVEHPLSMSLRSLGTAQLRSVVEGWRRSDAVDPVTGCNRDVWSGEVEYWARVADGRAGGAVVTIAPHRERPSLDALTSWADERGVHVVELDASEVIVGVSPDPSDVLGMDLTALVGHHLRNLLAVAGASFGDFVRSVVADSPPGVEDRWVEFGRGDETTTVRSLLVTGGGDRVGLLHLAARRGPLDSSVPADVTT